MPCHYDIDNKVIVASVCI